MAFLISTFQLLYFPRYQRGPNLHQGPYAPWAPPKGEIFVPKASTSQYLIVFLISTIQLQYIPRYQEVPNLRQGALCHIYAPNQKKFLYLRRVLTMSDGVFNFNFLALVLSEILGGSQIYIRGPYAPWTPPSGELFVPKVSTSTPDPDWSCSCR